jgi:hypothetical protein
VIYSIDCIIICAAIKESMLDKYIEKKTDVRVCEEGQVTMISMMKIRMQSLHFRLILQYFGGAP